jgi:predicted ester cyclase
MSPLWRAAIAACGSLLLMAAETKSQPLTQEERLNADVIRQATDAMNRHDIGAYAAYFADDAANFGRSVGREGIRTRIEDIFTTFPDYRHDIVELVSKGDTVVIRNKASGTHLGVGKYPLNGGMLVGVAPTRKHFEIQHIHWFKLSAGKIVSHTANRDDLGMMKQLGLLPAGQ